MRPIFLCGFMGCGKSTVGKILAKKMGCQCVDLDKYIEDTAGMSIPEIFDKYGEEHFRKLETEALAAFADMLQQAAEHCFRRRTARWLKDRAWWSLSTHISTPATDA